MSERGRNRLAMEASPYLLQHAHNPVDWYPWGPEALAAARAADKPIFLSIGYSACHWCHVMERESFENPATADLLNRHFVNIKVDREERPDLDQIYMNAVMLMTQHGGWPMSVWLTPDLKPFYGGTYFPPVRRFNMPAFTEIIENLAQAWRDRRAEIEAAATDMTVHLVRMGSIEPPAMADHVDAKVIAAAGRAIDRLVDSRHGGIGGAPKFPHSVELRLLLRAARRIGSEDLANSALRSLECMLRGGIYDQLGGGYHRYSTDERWLVPHFEKMLYDNALITLANLDAWQWTKQAQFSEAVCGTLDYLLREMQSPEGGFYSAQDADSEGVEGKFFVWTKPEVIAELGESDGEAFCYCYDISDQGNWEHANIPNRPKSLAQCSKLLKLEASELASLLDKCRSKLLHVRARRVPPATDTKVLTSWNAMAIDAFAAAGAGLDKLEYVEAATKAADFVLSTMRDGEGKLLRVFKSGVGAKLNAYLEDYAYLANALVTLYESTFELRWLREACDLMDAAFERYWDGSDGGFFFTSNDHETLIARGKDPHDGAIPSGNAMAATAMARLWHLTGKRNFADRLERMFELFAEQMKRSPTASAQLLIALGIYVGPTDEIAVIGNREDAEVRKMLQIVRCDFRPDKVVAFCEPNQVTFAGETVALLADKGPVPDRATAFVCRAFACRAPVLTAADLHATLAATDRDN